MQGLLLLNKPSGMTSFGAVAKIRRLTGEKRVGHTGTLDPMATGVLPILIGRATSLSGFLIDADKSYTATFLFGTVTDTDDITGNIIRQTDVNISEEDVLSTFKKFIGDIIQVPPAFSAIKKGGVPMYKLARGGQDVEVPPRRVRIFSIDAVTPLQHCEITVKVVCSKGTYIRALCRDIGEALGTGATLKSLRRDSTSGFDLSKCVDLDTLTEQNIEEHIIPAEESVKNLREVQVSAAQAVRFCNGGKLDVSRLRFSVSKDCEVLRIKYGNQFLGIGMFDAEKGEIRIKSLLTSADQAAASAVALGTFDGIHKGHKAVLDSALKSGYNPVAITFSLPPKRVLGKAEGVLIGVSEKCDRLRSMGFSEVQLLDFEKVKDLGPSEFLEKIKKDWNCKYISCGFNFRFGAGAAGDIDFLREYCSENGIELSIADAVTDGSEPISSTKIRRLLADGEIEKANELLGYDFGFYGVVVHGDMRGRTIGFPTINQMYPQNFTPIKFGVYKTVVNCEGISYSGVTNVGVRPTFHNDFISAETYIVNFSGDMYGKNVDIRFKSFIRPEKEFGSIDELKTAIQSDIQN